jgi:lipopolysaccharide export LptBFGC system permease protein LptF
MQDLTFEINCPKVVISGNNFGQTSVMDVTCSQKTVQNAFADTKLDQQAEQMAKAVTATLSLNPGSAEANNIMKLSMDVSTAVHNAANQLIAPATNQAQKQLYRLGCGESGTVDISQNQFTQYSKSITKGIQDSNQVASAVTALKQAAKQTASASQSSLLFIVIAVIAMIVLGPAIVPAKTKAGKEIKLALFAGLIGLAAYGYQTFKKSGASSALSWGKSLLHI